MDSRGHFGRISMVLLGYLLLVHLGSAEGARGDAEVRVKRQSRAAESRVEGSADLGPAGGSSAMAMSSTSPMMNSNREQPAGGNQNDERPSNSAARPQQRQPGQVSSQRPPDERAQDRPARPSRLEPEEFRPERHERRQDRRRHRDERREDEEGDYGEDCYDGYDDYDYSRQFIQMAANPMRQIGRMMNDIFSRMPPMSYAEDGQGGGGSGGQSVASSTAFGSSDGYSRLASTVSNNGRTRGIISETRNGRTQTRRIGDEQDE